MKLVVGLGNPGSIYAGTRHNIGSSVIKNLARDYRIALKKESNTLSLTGKAKLDNQSFVLAIPFRFMNLCGESVSRLLKKYKISTQGLLVVLDDLDLEFGRLRLRPSGSSAGHRGLKSIIEVLGSPDFARLRIGIGRPGQKTDAASYVLSRFSTGEKKYLKGIIGEAGACCMGWLIKGVWQTMNEFNTRRGNNE